MSQHFEVKDLGDLHYLLGIEVKRDAASHTFTLSQSQYIKEILERYKMLDAKPVKTPMARGAQYSTRQCPQSEKERKEMEGIPYRHAIGSLLYAAHGSRPDIIAAISVLSRFMDNPGYIHWLGVKRIFRYLLGTLDYCLVLSGAQSLALVGYCDVDHGGEVDTRRSTSGYVFYFGNSLISWSSKRQSCVSLSTAEAEYRAAATATQEGLNLFYLLSELGYKQKNILLYEDNQACLHLVENSAVVGRAKHLELKMYFIRDCVNKGLLLMKYCPTDLMIADLFTKPLLERQFVALRRLLNVKL